MKVHEIMKLRERRRRRDDDCCPDCGRPMEDCCCCRDDNDCCDSVVDCAVERGALKEYTHDEIGEASRFLCTFHDLGRNVDSDQWDRDGSFWAVTNAGYGKEIDAYIKGTFFDLSAGEFRLYDDNGKLRGMVDAYDANHDLGFIMDVVVKDGRMAWRHKLDNPGKAIPEVRACLESSRFKAQLDKVLRDAWEDQKKRFGFVDGPKDEGDAVSMNESVDPEVAAKVERSGDRKAKELFQDMNDTQKDYEKAVAEYNRIKAEFEEREQRLVAAEADARDAYEKADKALQKAQFRLRKLQKTNPDDEKAIEDAEKVINGDGENVGAEDLRDQARDAWRDARADLEEFKDAKEDKDSRTMKELHDARLAKYRAKTAMDAASYLWRQYVEVSPKDVTKGDGVVDVAVPESTAESISKARANEQEVTDQNAKNADKHLKATEKDVDRIMEWVRVYQGKASGFTAEEEKSEDQEEAPVPMNKLEEAHAFSTNNVKPNEDECIKLGFLNAYVGVCDDAYSAQDKWRRFLVQFENDCDDYTMGNPSEKTQYLANRLECCSEMIPCATSYEKICNDNLMGLSDYRSANLALKKKRWDEVHAILNWKYTYTKDNKDKEESLTSENLSEFMKAFCETDFGKKALEYTKNYVKANCPKLQKWTEEDKRILAFLNESFACLESLSYQIYTNEALRYIYGRGKWSHIDSVRFKFQKLVEGYGLVIEHRKDGGKFADHPVLGGPWREGRLKELYERSQNHDYNILHKSKVKKFNIPDLYPAIDLIYECGAQNASMDIQWLFMRDYSKWAKKAIGGTINNPRLKTARKLDDFQDDIRNFAYRWIRSQGSTSGNALMNRDRECLGELMENVFGAAQEFHQGHDVMDHQKRTAGFALKGEEGMNSLGAFYDSALAKLPGFLAYWNTPSIENLYVTGEKNGLREGEAIVLFSHTDTQPKAPRVSKTIASMPIHWGETRPGSCYIEVLDPSDDGFAVFGVGEEMNAMKQIFTDLVAGRNLPDGLALKTQVEEYHKKIAALIPKALKDYDEEPKDFDFDKKPEEPSGESKPVVNGAAENQEVKAEDMEADEEQAWKDLQAAFSDIVAEDNEYYGDDEVPEDGDDEDGSDDE